MAGADTISIHALREEGDGRCPRAWVHPDPISIHALREEGDDIPAPVCACCGKFLSTPSARRATVSLRFAITAKRHFYPRPPRGGRRFFLPRLRQHRQFLSTPSARRATLLIQNDNMGDDISIHALREEGDATCKPCKTTVVDFYPRPPRGGRLDELREIAVEEDFYPRPPRGGRLREPLP